MGYNIFLNHWGKERQTMNKLCKQYISNVKLLFPVTGKAEKEYLNSLASDIEDYCIEENIKTIDKLYERYGTPDTVLNTYFSVLNTDEVIKRIKIIKQLKQAVVLFLLIIVTAVFIWGINIYDTYQIFMQEQAVFTDSNIYP